MPIRTYTGISLQNYITNLLGSENGGTSSYVESSQANGAVTGSFNGVQSGEDVACSSQFNVEILGNFDFDQFPAIPANALITSVKYKVSGTLTGNANADSTPGQDGNCRICLSIAIFRGVDQSGELLEDILLAGSDDDGGINGTFSANVNVSDNYTTEQVFDYSGSPIDKATLVTEHGDIAIYVGNGDIINFLSSFAEARNFTAGSTADFSYGVTINGFQMIVEYQSGTEVIDITVNPSGGPVESGQPLIISSATLAMEGLTFAALIGDKVIPITSKINDDGTVTLEAPYPASEECFDCLGTCPECEDCFTACENDLDSQACIECLEGCYGCLENCLESPEFAEACIESSGEVTGDLPFILIAADPGQQFDGSVILGEFMIYTFEGSGIYKFVPGKTNDTLYNSIRNGSTYDVKIPNPFAKTSFFRS